MSQERNIFVFDTNKCVACHACVLACNFENNLPPNNNWRMVHANSGTDQPDIPALNLSIACNHCETAVCMINCPANAYTRDEASGAILIDDQKCIGCKYCTWACPYDAPKYAAVKGIIHKCTFCVHKLEEEEEWNPACTKLCPTGALSFQRIDADEPIVSDERILPNYDLNPSLKLIERRSLVLLPREVTDALKHNKTDEEVPLIPRKKLSLRKDWSLALFSFMSTLLFVLFVSHQFQVIAIDKWLFIGGLVTAFAFSLFHLGKVFRAYRSFINLARSWLSREVLFFTLFSIAASVSFIYEHILLGWVAVVIGLLLLIAIDMVYHVLGKEHATKLHSAHTILTGLFLSAFLLSLPNLWLMLGALKLVLYASRKYRKWSVHNNWQKGLASLRLDLLLTIPLILWWIEPAHLEQWVLLSFVIGEAIDRAEFYEER